jgi:hypothetical protein
MTRDSTGGKLQCALLHAAPGVIQTGEFYAIDLVYGIGKRVADAGFV